MFPAGRPGAALLLLRVSVGVLLVDGVSGPLLKIGSPWLLAAPIGIAIALALGTLTPVLAMLAILLEATTLVTTPIDLHAVHACAILDAFAIAFLGPGAYSLDALFFGRRQIVIPPDPPRHEG